MGPGPLLEFAGTLDYSSPKMPSFSERRRSFMKLLAAAPVFATVAAREFSQKLSAATGATNVYERIGVRPLINARGTWTYLTGSIRVDADGHAIRFADLSATTSDEGLASVVDPILSQLRDKTSVDYGIGYDNLLNAANAKLNRPLKDGYRMEGHLSSAKLEKLYLPADGVVIALRGSGELKILYGM